MRKNLIPVIIPFVFGLFFYSCSELILPKEIEVKGTLNLPVKIGTSNLGSVLADVINDAFSTSSQKSLMQNDYKRVYNVDYDGQTVMTFFINLPIEITENINPDHFLQTINQQLNDNISTEPRPINSTPFVYMGPGSSPAGFDIPSLIDLEEIARYVVSIDFDACDGTVDSEGKVQSGIGMDFYFTDIKENALAMRFTCPQLSIDEKKTLTTGHNIFGNHSDVTLQPAVTDKLIFSIMFEWDDTNPLFDLMFMDTFLVEGEMRFFYNWKEAKIELKKAIQNVLSAENPFTGVYPDTKSAFDLSGLRNYIGDGFTFNNLETKMYMNGPYADSINALQPNLLLTAQIDTDPDPLFEDQLLLNSEQIILSEFINNEKENYKERDLPFWDIAEADKIKKETIEKIFRTKPDTLTFRYSINFPNDSILTITNTAFTSDEDSKITAILMIMLPLSLTATGKDSWIGYPDILDGDDLFGRNKAEALIDSANIDYFKVTLDFFGSFFNGGHLFIHELLFPQGIALNGKTIIINITGKEFDIIRKNYPISPDIKLKFDKDATVNVPNNIGTAGIKIEMKGSVDLGELLE